MDQARLPYRATCYGGLRFLTERIVTEVVSHASYALAFPFELDQHFGFAGIHGEGFFAEHMLSGAKQAAGLFEMHVVGSADVHDADGRVRRQFVQRRIGAFQAQRAANFFASLAGTAEHPTHGDADSSQSFQVRSADKA